MHFLAQVFQFLIFARVDRVRILDGIEIRVAGGEKSNPLLLSLKAVVPLKTAFPIAASLPALMTFSVNAHAVVAMPVCASVVFVQFCAARASNGNAPESVNAIY